MNSKLCLTFLILGLMASCKNAEKSKEGEVSAGGISTLESEVRYSFGYKSNPIDPKDDLLGLRRNKQIFNGWILKEKAFIQNTGMKNLVLQEEEIVKETPYRGFLFDLNWELTDDFIVERSKKNTVLELFTSNFSQLKSICLVHGANLSDRFVSFKSLVNVPLAFNGEILVGTGDSFNGDGIIYNSSDSSGDISHIKYSIAYMTSFKEDKPGFARPRKLIVDTKVDSYRKEWYSRQMPNNFGTNKDLGMIGTVGAPLVAVKMACPDAPVKVKDRVDNYGKALINSKTGNQFKQVDFSKPCKLVDFKFIKSGAETTMTKDSSGRISVVRSYDRRDNEIKAFCHGN